MAMNPLNILVLLLTAFVMVFVQSHSGFGRVYLGTQIDILPSLVVYVAIRSGVFTLAGLAVLGGLWIDSLSASPLGLSILPMFVVGFLIHLNRDVVLREQGVTRFSLGMLAGILVPLSSLTLLMMSSDANPLVGWGTIWQLIVLGLVNGIATPVIFRVFGWVDRAMNYEMLPETTFRSDREIKRGRN